MYCRVVPFGKTFDSYGLVYFIPPHLEEEVRLYQAVTFPMKDSIELGIVLEILIETPEGIEENKIRSLIDVKEEGVLLFPYQAKIIDFISQHYITPIHNALSVFFPRNLREKIIKNTISKVTPQEYNYQDNREYTLTSAQERVFKETQLSQNKPTLLYGVTGSGKTEIYGEIIAKNLKQGKQSLLLIPEIILGNQIGDRIKDFFGEDVLILSSNVSEAKKTQYWIDIQSGHAKIIVGTRSSIFYPFRNLGIIIMDEEHDDSYKSDSAPRYQTNEICLKISQELDIPIIFASGTPSVTSMYKAMKGEYNLVNLLEKYTN